MNSPFDFLSLESLLSLTNLSARRDAHGFVFRELSEVSVEPPAWADELTHHLEKQLASLDPDALIELSALVTLGCEGGDYAGLLRQFRAKRAYGCLSAWVSGMPIHRYAAKGLAELGQAGHQVIALYPEMGKWLVDPSLADPVAEELSLAAIAELERELEQLAEKARLDRPFASYARSTCRTLDRIDDLDYFGCDEQMAYLTIGHAKRHHAVICICGDLEISKAYFYSGDLDAAALRLAHARNFISDLCQTITKGARIAQQAPNGGHAKARKLDPLKQEFMRLIEAKRPALGWGSMDRTAAALRDAVLKANDALDTGPVLSNSLESTLKSWLSKDVDVREVYFRNRLAKASS